MPNVHSLNFALRLHHFYKMHLKIEILTVLRSLIKWKSLNIKRLFLPFQLSTSVLYFSNVLWPQITFWHFLASILAYQRDRWQLDDFRRAERMQSCQLAKATDFYSERVQNFLTTIDEDRRKLLVRLAAN